jgi:Undecaprenyl-phosphate galactose phosphotransferase WbaP
MDTSEKAQNLPLLSHGSSASESQPWGEFLYRDFFKRIFDLVLCILFLPLTLPVLLILMVLIKLDSRGPTIFKSERIGKDGKKFQIYKLRTMCLNANERLKELLKENEDLRTEWVMDHKLKNDPRITRVGKVIRALSLDELPQVFNVLKGEMSFVGPRPIVEDEVPKYGKQFNDYKNVRPGITGLWQTNGRNDISYDERVKMDKEYVNYNHFTMDLKILLKTIPAALSKKGAY